MLLRQANRTIAMVRDQAGNSDLNQALANVGTVLTHWINVLERDDEPPHQVQRHD